MKQLAQTDTKEAESTELHFPKIWRRCLLLLLFSFSEWLLNTYPGPETAQMLQMQK